MGVFRFDTQCVKREALASDANVLASIERRVLLVLPPAALSVRDRTLRGTEPLSPDPRGHEDEHAR